MASMMRAPSRLSANSPNTSMPAVIFHHCKGSPNTMAALNMPVTGTGSVKGAMIAVGYLRISTDQIPQPKIVFG